jgi:hypothetical protein
VKSLEVAIIITSIPLIARCYLDESGVSPRLGECLDLILTFAAAADPFLISIASDRKRIRLPNVVCSCFYIPETRPRLYRTTHSDPSPFIAAQWRRGALLRDHSVHESCSEPSPGLLSCSGVATMMQSRC